MDAEEASEIGARARMIRRRRGLAVDVAAGLAGISTSYLSMLERGQRGFNRRGLLEDLAGALGCSVADLTGQPYLPMDRQSADTVAAIPGVGAALHDTTLDDIPDVRVAMPPHSGRDGETARQKLVYYSQAWNLVWGRGAALPRGHRGVGQTVVREPHQRRCRRTVSRDKARQPRRMRRFLRRGVLG
jgi:transcriptional regulator with XRE-family HTH domain